MIVNKDECQIGGFWRFVKDTSFRTPFSDVECKNCGMLIEYPLWMKLIVSVCFFILVILLERLARFMKDMSIDGVIYYVLTVVIVLLVSIALLFFEYKMLTIVFIKQHNKSVDDK